MIFERTWLTARASRWAGLACLGLALACGGPQDDDSSDTTAAAPQASAKREASGTTGPPQRGGWLVLELLSDPENLNPYTANDQPSNRVLGWIFDSLLTVDPETFGHRPLVARELPEISDDQLTYTFRLRENVTFSDGKPLTAQDVIFSLKTIRHPKVAAPQLRNYYDSLESATAVDSHTVRIDLAEVYFRNTWMLGGFEILPRHYYDPDDLLGEFSVAQLNDWDALDAEQQARAERFAKHFNEDFARRPLGSGAYFIEDPKRDVVTGEQVVLRHRANFWGMDDTDLGDGWVDRIVFRVINDTEAQLVAFKAGKLDYILRITPIQATRQTNNARFQQRSRKHAEVLNGYAYIGWNQLRPIFADKRVRRALSHLVDKQNIVDKVMLGLAQAVEGPVFPKRPEYNRDLAPWTYSPEKAEALLAEAGWSDSDGDGILDKEIDGQRVPLRFEIVSNAGNDERRKVGLAVIDSFKRHGIDASFRAVDWSILLERLNRADVDAVIMGWGGGGAMIPPDLYQIWHSSQAIENGSNHIRFKHAELDGILERYRVEFDAEERKRLYRRAQEILYDEQPYTFLYTRSSVSVWDRRFSNADPYPGVGLSLNEWWVPVDLRRY